MLLTCRNNNNQQASWRLIFVSTFAMAKLGVCVCLKKKCDCDWFGYMIENDVTCPWIDTLRYENSRHLVKKKECALVARRSRRHCVRRRRPIERLQSDLSAHGFLFTRVAAVQLPLASRLFPHPRTKSTWRTWQWKYAAKMGPFIRSVPHKVCL